MYKLFMLCLLVGIAHGTILHSKDLKFNQLSHEDGNCVCWFSDGKELLSTRLETSECNRRACDMYLRAAPAIIKIPNNEKIEKTLKGPYYHRLDVRHTQKKSLH